jgi:hypothetical protein
VRATTRRTGQPQQQIDGVYALVHQRAAAIERPRAAPARAFVVGRRPIPFHARTRENRRAEPSRIHERFQAGDVRFQPILEDDAERHACGVCRRDQIAGARHGHVDRFFDEHMQPALCRSDPVLGVKAGRTADDDGVERSMIEQQIERIVGGGVVPIGQRVRMRMGRRVNRGDCGAARFLHRSRVRVADVAGADQPDVDRQSLAPARVINAFIPAKL